VNAMEEVKRRIREKIALLEAMKRTAAESGADALHLHMMCEGLRMALRIIEEVEAEARSMGSRLVECPNCGRRVTPGLYYALHHFGICLEPVSEGEEEAGDVSQLAGGAHRRQPDEEAQEELDVIS